MELHLKRPLAFFDIEATGISISKDRIVEISIAKAMPDGDVQTLTRRINPTIPIPYETSIIHGIYDEDVKDEPTFEEVAQELYDFLQDADLAGFNLIKFDVPILVEEFLRADMEFTVDNRKIVDAQRIFHMMEPRDLKAAYRFYCNKDLTNAHSAEADALATYEILKAQIDRYQDVTVEDKDGNITYPIKNDVDELHKLTSMQFADLCGRIKYNQNGDEVFNFGKYKNRPVKEVLDEEPNYYDWVMRGDFALSTKRKLLEIKLRKMNEKSG